FIYTKCTDTCPLQTADMAQLQDRWLKEKQIKLVSFSVDPEHDTPPVLSRYASRFKADPKRWLFLTGHRPEIVRLVENGFHLAVASASSRAHGGAVILHSPRFVLVDQQGQIRGYYDNSEPTAMQRLNQDVESLLNHK
ncbi:MAG: SCO family protein, partial [Candidatus Binatia bacterium]